jgi:hypothetical protein
LRDDKDSRRKFLERAAKALLGGIALQSLKGDAPSGGQHPRQVSWRKAMHYAKTHRLAG